jgi:hypothetical protein
MSSSWANVCVPSQPRFGVAPLQLAHEGWPLVGEHEPGDPVGAEEPITWNSDESRSATPRS